MRSFIRLFFRRKAYYLTNIAGLAVGLAATGFSILYFQHELGYDAFHRDAERIHRVSYQNDSGWFASLHRKYVSALMQDTIPEIEEMARLRRWFSKYVYVGENKFYESKVLLTDPGSKFFSMFDFPFQQGNALQSLERPNSVVISSSIARKYFGNRAALGESILYDTMALTVTGVFVDLPTNSTFTFDLLIANADAMKTASGSFTFVRLHEHTDIAKLESKIFRAPIEDKYHKMKGVRIIPLRDLHYEADFTYEMKPAGNKSYLWILGAIGITILLIAFANFLNLSVALYARRSREIAVRKSVGATSLVLSRQFFSESAITITIALVLSLLSIYALKPALNELLEVRLPNPLTSMPFVSLITALLMFMVLVSGLYPAVILPRIRIADLFKQTGIASNNGVRLRVFLLGFQLIILFFVCCALWVIYGQFQFIHNKDLGFKKDGVIKIRRAWEVDSTQYHKIKSLLLEHSSIHAVSQGYAPGDEDYGVTYRNNDGGEIEEGALIQRTDYDYLPVLGIQAIEGQIVNADVDNQPHRLCVVNETMVKELGYDQPVGRKITMDPGLDHEKTYTIDGVVKDYHFSSLHHTIVPQVLLLDKRSKYVSENILIKASTKDLPETVAFIQAKIDEVIPGIPAVISFLDDDLARLYKQETRLSKIVSILATISLVLCIVGLVALCSYMIEFRQREIAIRKILGAATSSIISLFTTIFFRTTVAAFVIATPLCLWAMSKWMEVFAYREQIQFSLFLYVLLGVLSMTIGLAAVQTIRTAMMNPVKILKE